MIVVERYSVSYIICFLLLHLFDLEYRLKEFIGIQYLRGIAAVLIIIYHSMVMTAVTPFFTYPIGEFGVDIFFVISGFIMWVTTEYKNPTPFSFFKARLLRVYPLYWFFTLLLLASVFFVPSAFLNQRSIDVWYIMKSLLLIPSYNPDVGDITPIYTIGWTLVYEMFFYAIFTVSLSIKTSWIRISALFVFFSSLIIAGSLYDSHNPMFLTYTNPFIIEFIAGAMLGFATNKILLLKEWVGSVFISIATLLFIFGVFYGSSLPRVMIYGSAASFLVISFITFENKFSKRKVNIALLIGNASFSLYLVHPFAQRAWFIIENTMIGKIASFSNAILYMTGAVLAGIIGGLICHLLNRKTIAEY
ncbi:Acyltransferase family protein [Serratia symbiotica SCt-VLC]|uniref:Acyltransferase family protein n=1 Tax=Serratia symbiotica SCt-VLC TaxID=1347341 RepID=A0A068RDG4_9GAMM|nr:Acyltransferase family protein [Serratia symbiotica SCt-VLC]